MTEEKNKEEIINEQRERLEEMTKIQFGTFSDDEILRFLAERKRLVVSITDYEKAKQEELALRKQKEKEEALKIASENRMRIVGDIEKLNQTISPDKKDDELLALISERKKLEKELSIIDTKFPELNRPTEVIPPPEQREEKKEEMKKEKETVPEETPTEVLISREEEKKALSVEPETTEKKKEDTLPSTLGIVDGGLGGEKIEIHGIEVSSEFTHYVDQLQSNAGSLGEFLQQLPVSAKKNKAFMLKVAEMDPAYAMHYADSFVLKRDEDFNIRIAMLKNPRNSGNALSEMLPEFRTSKVVLAGVKQDYRNVKFIQPDMKDYDEILTIAKKGTLDKVRSMKDSADITVLVPKIFQQDKQFMSEIESIKAESK